MDWCHHLVPTSVGMARPLALGICWRLCNFISQVAPHHSTRYCTLYIVCDETETSLYHIITVPTILYTNKSIHCCMYLLNKAILRGGKTIQRRLGWLLALGLIDKAALPPSHFSCKIDF